MTGARFAWKVSMLVAVLLAASVATAQTKPSGSTKASGESPLYSEIAEQDAAMFAAFNAHDLPGLMKYFSEDLEFYHDKDGQLSYAKVTDGFKRLFANNTGLQRQLVAGTLEVYPVPGYGAMEIGSHRFCHMENGKEDCGVFEFAMIWQKKNDRWRVTRVLSYGH